MKKLRATSVGTLTLMLALASPATAATAVDQATAEVLFQEGLKLAAAADFEHAASKFAESQRLDPGAGTLLNLGDAYEHLGKLASAWGAFKEAESTARHAGSADKEAEAIRRATALAPKLPKLSIVVPPAARVPGFEVRRDGELVGEGQWGSGLPIDAGNHTVEATAPGYKPWSTVMRIETNGGAAQIEIPPLVKGSADALPGAFWGAQRIAGVVVGTTGVVGLGVGAALGALALSKNTASKANCSPTDPNLCNDLGASVRADAVALGNGSTAALVIGGAMVVGGIVLFATAPSIKRPEAARIEVLPGVGRLAIRGTF